MPAALPGPHLYLELAPGESAKARLDAALAEHRFAAVLIRQPSARAPLASLAPLVEAAQGRGAAVLVEGDAELARALSADGVHLPWSEDLEQAYAKARAACAKTSSIGIEAGGSRHAAMSLGEAGADYIAFAPDTGAPGTQLDLVAWWAEIFEPPCVALGVTKPDEAVALAEAGADFVGIPAEAGLAPDDLARRIKAIAAALETCARVGAGEAP